MNKVNLKGATCAAVLIAGLTGAIVGFSTRSNDGGTCSGGVHRSA